MGTKSGSNSRALSIFRGKRANEKGSVLVEFAISAPLLVTIILGIVGAGNILTELPWSAHTAYQLASVLAENPTDVGEIALLSRGDQLRNERLNLFSRLGLGNFRAEGLFPNNPSHFHGTINNVEVVGVRFNAEINSIVHITLPRALSIEFTAPHLASSIDVAAINGFADPAASYDCCGRRCGESGSTCGNPTTCYDNNGLWIETSACPMG